MSDVDVFVCPSCGSAVLGAHNARTGRPRCADDPVVLPYAVYHAGCWYGWLTGLHSGDVQTFREAHPWMDWLWEAA